MNQRETERAELAQPMASPLARQKALYVEACLVKHSDLWQAMYAEQMANVDKDAVEFWTASVNFWMSRAMEMMQPEVSAAGKRKE